MIFVCDPEKLIAERNEDSLYIVFPTNITREQAVNVLRQVAESDKLGIEDEGFCTDEDMAKGLVLEAPIDR